MKLKIEAIKVTRGLLANPRALSRVIENTLSAAALGVKADFGVTTQTWSKENKPRFRIEKKIGERKVSTGSEIFGFVDDGTRPHLIRAKGKKPLRFRRNSVAKTRARHIGSGAGGSSGGWVSKRVISHPGTKAREFSKTIAEKWDKELPTLMQRSIDSAIE